MHGLCMGKTEGKVENFNLSSEALLENCGDVFSCNHMHIQIYNQKLITL